MAFVRYIDCPKCKKTAELKTTTILIKLNNIEIKQREIAKRMVKDLLGKKTLRLNFLLLLDQKRVAIIVTFRRKFEVELVK